MKKILFLGAILLLAFLFSTDLLSYLFEFITSLLILDSTKPDVSLISEAIISIITYVFSFGTVGFIFNLIGLHERNIMRLSYWVVSILVGFLLSNIFFVIESYAFDILLIVVSTGTLTWIIAMIVKVLRSSV